MPEVSKPLGSRTSGVDGSSEGGRINTNLLPYTLVLYAVPLIDQLRRSGYGGKLTASPVEVDGTWCLQLTYDGNQPRGLPKRWHGHRVVAQKAKPPPSV